MNQKGQKIGAPVLDGRYQLLQQVIGSFGGKTIHLGEKGACRYCGETDAARFRKLAHAFPEGLGNKWVFSNDECDRCNGFIFSRFDDELVNAVSPFLTLGGVRGKENKVRSMGRSAGARHIEQHRRGADGRRSILAVAKGVHAKEIVSADPTGRWVKLTTPLPPVPFRPRLAYKALSKMAVALLPREELDNYRKLIAWLQDIHDTENFEILEVGMSFASVGNAPPYAIGSLLRRTNPRDPIPHIIFIFCAGSICLQIDLMSDHMEDHIPATPRGSINISWNVVVDDAAGNSLALAYGPPRHFNWASRDSMPQPVRDMVLEFDTLTTIGRWTPIFRDLD